MELAELGFGLQNAKRVYVVSQTNWDGEQMTRRRHVALQGSEPPGVPGTHVRRTGMAL